MSRSRDAKVIRYGVIALIVMALVSAATFNLSKFPGFKGTTYYAEFSDANGLDKGNVVQVGGIRVGRVNEVTLDGPKVRVEFEVEGDVAFGPASKASVEVYNLLGEKYLDLAPAGEGQLEAGGTIPLKNTDTAYDIVAAFGDLTQTTEAIDTEQLSKALDVVGETLNEGAPEIEAAFEGISRLSRTVASRDAEIQQLFQSSQQVSNVLEARSEDIVELMGSADLIFKELQKRRQAVHDLLVNARSLSKELRGLVKDNEKQIGPALAEVDELTSFLVGKKKQIKELLVEVGPYVSILSNILGTGPWFDAYAANLFAIPTGEFVPGFPEVE